MALIQFKNLPDTSTPLTAENLNNNFNYLDGKTDNYSTSEVLTDKVWIDGKPIYRKVIVGEITATGDWTTIPNSKITNYYFTTSMTSTYERYLPIPAYVNSSYSIALQYNASEGLQYFANGYNSGNIYIIIEYTKTTD